MQNEQKLAKQTDPELIALARQMSGEGYGTAITYMNFNGEDGIYFLSTGKKDENTDKTVKEAIGKNWEGGVILKSRNRVNTYLPKENKVWRSEEFDSFDQPITIKDKFGNITMQGNYKECKAQDKDIKLEKILYVYNDGIYKIAAKGGSLSQWINYIKTYAQHETVMGYKTTFSTKQESSDFGSYWVITFQRGEQVDLKESIGLAKQLDNALQPQTLMTNTQRQEIVKQVQSWNNEEPPIETYNEYF